MPRERRSRWVSILGSVVGGVYVVFGIGEVAAHVDEPGSLVFWVLSLLGGGALVLYGVFGRDGVSTRLVVAGALLGIVGTAWTLIVPVLSMVLVVLTFHNAQRPPAAP